MQLTGSLYQNILVQLCYEADQQVLYQIYNRKKIFLKIPFFEMEGAEQKRNNYPDKQAE